MPEVLFNKKETKYLFDHRAEVPETLAAEFIARFRNLPTKSIVQKVYGLRRDFKKAKVPKCIRNEVSITTRQKLVSKAPEVKPNERGSHARNSFTDDQIVVLAQDGKSVGDVLLEFIRKFPDEKIASISTFSTWVASAKNIMIARKSEKLRAAEKSTNDLLNRKDTRSNPMVDEDRVLASIGTNIALQNQILEDILKAIKESTKATQEAEKASTLLVKRFEETRDAVNKQKGAIGAGNQ
jgi:uncharacterized coiled-coil protein SlyX